MAQTRLWHLLSKSGAQIQMALHVLRKSVPLLWQASPVLTVLVGIVMVVQGILPSVSVWITKPLADEVIRVASGQPGATPERAWLLAGAWLAAVLLASALSPVALAIQGLLTDRLTAEINLRLMQRAGELPGLTSLENPEFYDNLQIIEEESAWRPVNLMVFSVGLLRYLISAVAMLLILAQFHPLIPIVIALTALPHAFVSFRLQNDAFEVLVWKSPEARKMKYYSSVMLTDAYAKEVRIHRLTQFFLDLYRLAFDKVYRVTRGMRLRHVAWSSFFLALGVLGVGSTLLWTTKQAMGGFITAGGLVLFIQAVLFTQQDLVNVVENGSMLYDTLLYMRKLFDFLETEPDLKPAHSGRTLMVPSRLQQGIAFEAVGFDYPGGRTALHEVRFQLKPGEKVALVGENGAGKTTIVKLICRLYDPSRGRILVDGRDLREYDLEAWRKQIAVVFQDFARFHLPVKENIGIGSIEAMDDLDRIHQAAIRSGAASFVARLPRGMETFLGKQFADGVDLSGGEWQKIAMARAFMKDAQILILDEPTASLDPRSEHEVYEKFTELVGDKTVLLISHRLSAVRLSDRILVLQDGRIVEQGSHEELMRLGGIYAEMYHMQADRYELGG